jgi:hypothetical protein
MKKALTILYFILSLALNAQSTDEEIFLRAHDFALLELISSQSEITLDHKDEHGIELYGPKGTTLWLESIGATPLKLADTDFDTNTEVINGKAQDSYPTSEQVNNKLFALQERFPHIMKVISIGKTVQGKELLAIKVSDNPNQDEKEPEFKYIGNMHGNEIVGRDMLVALIEHLGKAYKSGDSRIVELVNSTEIFIMPSMNPDGADRKRRGNANRVDLNRDFPDFSTRDNRNEIDNRQPEVAAIMKWQRARHFSLSANFHGGTKVVNYPWDTAKDPAPFTNLIQQISRRYASTVPGFYNSSRYKDGIVNGNAWYEVDGGMQDWSYFYHNDLQVTIELSHSKWPRYSEIPQYFLDNREALIGLISGVHQGLGLIVPNLSQVELFSKGQSLGTFGVKKGEFYKVLPIGDYQIKYIDPVTTKKMVINTQVNSAIASSYYRP